MENNMFKKWLAVGITTIMIGMIFGTAGNAVIIENTQIFNISAQNEKSINSNVNYSNITVHDAWNLLTDTNNGIQIPIDVRTDEEWSEEHIDTPSPENPRHYCLDLLQNETGLQEFMSLYTGSEIILYCKSGYRSFLATKILDNNNFTGGILNMIGGIDEWKMAGYPTVGETESIPDLDCSGTLSWSDVKPGETINGFFTIENIGDVDSLLDWKILTWPSWGNWTFTKSSGNDLESGDVETIGVTVIAPYENNADFSGNLLVINVENGSDYDTIDVYLTTQRNKAFTFNLFEWLFECFPKAFPILRNLLEL